MRSWEPARFVGPDYHSRGPIDSKVYIQGSQKQWLGTAVFCAEAGTYR